MKKRKLENLDCKFSILDKHFRLVQPQTLNLDLNLSIINLNLMDEEVAECSLQIH